MPKEKKKPGRPPKTNLDENSEQLESDEIKPKEPDNAQQFEFDRNPEKTVEKTLNNVDMETLKQNVSDVEIYGDPGKWLCLSKASSKSQKWMKSTKAMNVPGFGCVVQVSEQQGENLSTSITPIQGVGVYPSKYGGYRLVGHLQKNEPEE